MSLRDKIKEVDDIRKETATIAVWGDAEVEVRSLTGTQRANNLTESMDENGKLDQIKFHKGLILNTCFDPETGERLFADDDDWIMQKNAAAIEQLIGVAMRVSGLAGGAVEEAEKN